MYNTSQALYVSIFQTLINGIGQLSYNAMRKGNLLLLFYY